MRYGPMKKLQIFYDNVRTEPYNSNYRERLAEDKSFNVRIDKSEPYDPDETWHNFVCGERSYNGGAGRCSLNLGKNNMGLTMHIAVFHDNGRIKRRAK